MDRYVRLRPGVVPARSRRRLGALSRRLLAMVSVLRLDVGFVRAVGLGAVSLRSVGLRARPVVLGAGSRQYRPGDRLALETASCSLLRMGRQLQPRLSRRVLRWLLEGIPRRALRISGLVPARAARSALRAEGQRATPRSSREFSRAGGGERDGRAQIRRRPRPPSLSPRRCAISSPLGAFSASRETAARAFVRNEDLKPLQQIAPTRSDAVT